MLRGLSIKDLAVVESLELEFDSGLTVLTGETGAGKSILLTALGLALGERADSGFIRPGAARAEINLEFSLDDAPPARAWLADNELLDEDETCMIRRVVNQDGRSKAFVNGRPTNLQTLQELASKLVEIHGQHAHLRLLKPDEQRCLLDESNDAMGLLAEVESLCKRWRAVREELEAGRKALRDSAAREELLRYQIEEMEQHEVESLDYAALSEEHTLQANMGKILAVGQSQLELLYENERHSVNALLSQAIHGLEDIAQIAPEFAEIVALLGEARIQVKEAGLALRRRLERLEVDPQRLEWLDEKLADLHRLARKHHASPQELRAHLDNLRQELSGVTHNAEQAARLEAELARLQEEYAAAARRMTATRVEGARRLQARISETIRELGMPQGQFLIEVHTDAYATPGPAGADRVEFLVSANPGLPPRPLAKVASGGELSRISLGLQVAATDSKTTPTLIFDEVDTGIGGGVAEIVGRKLRLLGRERQVFCVTHLHQVAAQGHRHLLVEKLSAGASTQTRVRELLPDERKHEIARMLGGLQITEQTLAHAEEMLKGVGQARS
jgi:DNA repair protein RecN (Recombination protein N)